jgi:hypothetical protein
MTKKLNIKLKRDQFFKDANDLNIDEGDSYLLAYPYFLTFFEHKPTLTEQDLVIGIHFTYGWMPTIFKFGDTERITDALEILNRAKDRKSLTVGDLQTLKILFKNSLVGTSKLLHFINPSAFAIWDSRVFRYLTQKYPTNEKMGNCEAYLAYLDFCKELIEDSRFGGCMTEVEKQVGYPLSAMRVVELVMFIKGAKEKAEKLEFSIDVGAGEKM